MIESPPLVTAPLADGARLETVVIGGGYTGLSTALHLAERGRAVAVLEAREPGWGAAGRNGGQVNAGVKQEPDAVVRMFGPVYGPRLVRLSLLNRCRRRLPPAFCRVAKSFMRSATSSRTSGVTPPIDC